MQRTSLIIEHDDVVLLKQLAEALNMSFDGLVQLLVKHLAHHA